MKSFLLNLGRLLGLILCASGVMFAVRCLIEPHQTLAVNLGCATAWGVMMGALTHYRAKYRD